MDEHDFKNETLVILESVPDLCLILNTDLQILGASQAYLNATMTESQKIIGRNFFEIFPNNSKVPSATDIEHLRGSFHRALTNKAPDIIAVQQQESHEPGKIRYWSTQNSPILDKKNNVKYILHRVINLTSEMEVKEHAKHLDKVNKQLRIAEAINVAIIKAIPDAMLTINNNGLITDVNQALETLFRYDKDELLGQQIEVLIPQPYHSRYLKLLKNYFKSPSAKPIGHNMALFAQKKKGELFSIEINLSPLSTSQGRFAIAIIRDISLRAQQTKLLQIKEKELIEANNKLEIDKYRLEMINKKAALLTELSETLIACKNQDEMLIVISTYANKILDFSKGILYLFDASHKYLEGTTTWGNPDKYEYIITPEECWAIRRGLFHETNLSEPGIPCDHIKDHKHNLTYICVPVMAQNEILGSLYIEIENYHHATVIEHHLLINMVSKTIALAIANINLRNLLRDQSIRDTLTGLYNRRFLDEFLIKQLFYAKRQKQTLAIILFDLDDFKKINDTYGHEVGDIILEKLGKLMMSITRAEDAVCRYGGEEFICILLNCSLILAKKRAEEFRQKIQDMTKEHFPPAVTISLGISIYPTDGHMPNELIETADKALYESKKTGKNKVTVYSDMCEID